MAIAERTLGQNGEPTWEIAHLFPYQGAWTEAEYLALDTNRLIELTDGRLEVLPMPSIGHQRVVQFFYRLLYAYLSEHAAGEVFMAPLPTYLRAGKYREPDLAVVLAQNRWRTQGKYLRGADLVMEVVSPDDPERDYIRKRADYAEAGIAEYWIVDPEQQSITVLQCVGEQYTEAGIYRTGMQARSVLLAGLEVSVESLVAAAG